MNDDQERRAIRAAMDRLLTGRPLRTAGALTIVGLAQEADVKRHVLTHRHIDLKDEFYARVHAQNHVSPQLAAAHDQNDALQRRLNVALEDNRGLTEQVRALARQIEPARRGKQCDATTFIRQQAAGRAAIARGHPVIALDFPLGPVLSGPWRLTARFAASRVGLRRDPRGILFRERPSGSAGLNCGITTLQ